jgi:ABC-type branched-subunit amino acid transport system substrate-binding protein
VTAANGQLMLGAAVSLSGRYASQGLLASAGLQQAVVDARSAGGVVLGGRRVVPDVVILDDESTRAGVRRSLDALAAADLIVGPYGSDLVREAARWASERERVLWNHGGSADDVERSPGVVSVASPASRYLAAVLEALAGRVDEGWVLVAVGRGRFGEAAASGAREAAAHLGISTVGVLPHDEVPDAPDAEALLAAGSFDEDVTLLRRLRVPPPVIGVVAGGMGGFAGELGPRAEGVLAPSQWEEGVHYAVDVGPRQAEVVRALRARVVPKLRTGMGPGHVDYLSAQAYAIVLVALRCVEDAGSLEDEALGLAAQRLRCTTFFGRFSLAPDGRQRDHDVLVVQWRAGVKRLVWPPGVAETQLSTSVG